VEEIDSWHGTLVGTSSVLHGIAGLLHSNPLRERHYTTFDGEAFLLFLFSEASAALFWVYMVGGEDGGREVEDHVTQD
jgi:hypothetical protein